MSYKAKSFCLHIRHYSSKACFILYLISFYIIPVSYTHLDVYKRQATFVKLDNIESSENLNKTFKEELGMDIVFEKTK